MQTAEHLRYVGATDLPHGLSTEVAKVGEASLDQRHRTIEHRGRDVKRHAIKHQVELINRFNGGIDAGTFALERFMAKLMRLGELGLGALEQGTRRSGEGLGFGKRDLALKEQLLRLGLERVETDIELMESVEHGHVEILL